MEFFYEFKLLRTSCWQKSRNRYEIPGRKAHLPTYFEKELLCQWNIYVWSLISCYKSGSSMIILIVNSQRILELFFTIFYENDDVIDFIQHVIAYSPFINPSGPWILIDKMIPWDVPDDGKMETDTHFWAESGICCLFCDKM